MKSIWKNNITPSEFNTLDGSISTDVLVVGGGIAGLLCAYRLKEAGVDCVLAEAKGICSGTTGNTTAKITLAHGLIYSRLIKRFGETKARLYLEAQQRAGSEYARLCSTIDCDYARKDSYIYSLSDRSIIEDEINALNRLGVKAEFSPVTEIPVRAAGAVRVRNQAQFHPLKFLYGISRDAKIYVNTKITQFMPRKVVTESGEIAFRKLVVATHFPVLNKHGGYFLKLYQHRSYVLALSGVQSLSGMYADESDSGLSFRSCGNQLILGGGGCRTGKKGGGWQELEQFAARHYTNAQITARWAAQDCMTLDGVPYIGQYAKALPDVYVAAGFNKWGMTGAMAAADILCDLVCGRDNPFAEVFSPSRNILHPQLAANAVESVAGLLTPTAPRCPHLGCALKYNSAEHTWDCPCHGSRFAENGELIDNPATSDLNCPDK